MDLGAGTKIVYDKARRDSVPLADLIKMLEKSKPVRVAGTAVFSYQRSRGCAGALLHNLKHNKVLHKRNIVLTIKTADMPRVPDAEKLEINELSEDVKAIIVRVGYMETPRVPHFLALARRRGLDFDIMQTSFFLSRRSIKPAASSGMPLAGQPVHLPLPHGCECDGLLPHPHGACGGDGRASHGLRSWSELHCQRADALTFSPPKQARCRA